MEIFKHFRTQQIEYDAILPIVQFALAVPGTNAPIERIFSLMNDMYVGATAKHSLRLKL